MHPLLTPATNPVSNGLVTHVFFFRRVHITQATLDYLGGEYEVEPGNGATRNQYLRDHCVTTYFIVPPARRRKVLVTSQNDRRGCILLHPNDRIFCGPLWNGARYRQPVWTISLINLFELVFVTRRIYAMMDGVCRTSNKRAR